MITPSRSLGVLGLRLINLCYKAAKQTCAIPRTWILITVKETKQHFESTTTLK